MPTEGLSLPDSASPPTPSLGPRSEAVAPATTGAAQAGCAFAASAPSSVSTFLPVSSSNPCPVAGPTSVSHLQTLSHLTNPRS